MIRYPFGPVTMPAALPARLLPLAISLALVLKLAAQEFVSGEAISVEYQPVETIVRYAEIVEVESAQTDTLLGGQVVVESNVDQSSTSVAQAATIVPHPNQPLFTDEAKLEIEGGLAVLLTHFTDRLDTEYGTRAALGTLTEASKANDWPLIYLHEGSANPDQYFYAHPDPTAFVDSSLGRFQFDTTTLNHVVIAGGFYELCLDNTFSQVVENWSHISEEKQFRITFVMDAIYGVASDSWTEDAFNTGLRDWIREQPSTTVVMNSVLKTISEDKHAWTFLSRRWKKIPKEFGLHVRYGDELRAIRFAVKSKPTIVIHYTTAAAFAESVDKASNRPLPVELALSP